MSDLRPFLSALYDVYSAQSTQSASALYQQIQAAGAETFEIQFQHGRVLNSKAWSDLKLSIMIAEKKGKSWRVARETAQDLTALLEWKKTHQRLVQSAQTETDPRPAFVHNPKLEVLPPNLLKYDAQVASELPALVFHRAFQTFQPILKRKFVMDAVCAWHHGGRSWQNSALPFAWCDNHGFWFLPQTRIDETIAIYAPEKPQKRRVLAFSNDRLDRIIPTKHWCDALQSALQQPWIDWNLRHFDRIVLMPHVVAQIIAWFLKRLTVSPKFAAQAGAYLDKRLALFDNPEHPAFMLHGLIPANGAALKPSLILAEGKVDKRFTKTSVPEIYCPVLCSAQSEKIPQNLERKDDNYPTQTPAQPQIDTDELDMPAFMPEMISAHLAGNSLCIEHARILEADTDRPRLYLPTGAILCRDGQCLGHVVPPSQPLDMLSMLKNAMPCTQTLRIGGIACCGVAHEPT